VANFEWQNSQGPGNPLPGLPPPELDRWCTEVEWARTVFPGPGEEWVEKTGPETISVGSDLVYALEYGNKGPADAGEVTLRRLC
jgi:hypothetical protein